MQRKKVPGRAGFTLVEMMIILLVIGVMAGLAAPPMFRYIQSNRLKTTADRMMADMQYARALSISSGRVMQFSVTGAGYQVIDTNLGTVVRSANFKGMALDTPKTSNFFPWGMADGIVFNVSNASGTKQVTLLPTGLVEVN